MAFLQLDERQITLRAGDTLIGSQAGADVAIDGVAASGPAVVVSAGPSGIIARLGTAGADVRVNGVSLGAEPVPLIHGDRLEVGGRTLIFGDAAKGGSTAFFSGANVAELLRQRESSAVASPAARARTGSTGGRLVSLTDGREYAILKTPFTIGRDPAADVVVASTDVSRTHAEIEVGADGYYLIDTSTNGVSVNGAKVDGTFTLARGDVLRVGPEEFRFYADKLTEAAPAASPAVAPAPEQPAGAVAPARPVLASLEVSGAAGPYRFALTEVLAQFGRGAHNDLVVPEDSVSDSHAKLQRRADGWYVVDMGSTNGTFVGGVRVEGEVRLGDSADLKFGAVRAVFRTDEAPAVVGGKGETAVLSAALAAQLAQQAAAKAVPVAPAPAAPATAPKPAAAPRPAPSPVPASSGGVPVWVWIVGLLAVAGGAYFLLQGR